MYSNTTNQVKKTISRFHHIAYSGCFRHDGRLITAGSEEGVVKVSRVGCLVCYKKIQQLQVFEVGSRAILRQYEGHTK